MSRKTLIHKFMGIRENYYDCEEICVYKLKLEFMEDNGLDISKESKVCLACNGINLTCPSYATIEHLVKFYENNKPKRI